MIIRNIKHIKPAHEKFAGEAQAAAGAKGAATIGGSAAFQI